MIVSIDKLIKEYEKYSKGAIDYKKYAYYAITHHSTVIEGSTLTSSQVINLLEFDKPTPNKPFEHHQMVFDHYKALLFATITAKNKEKLSPELIKSINANVMKNTGGFVNTIAGSYNISNGDFRLGTVRAGNRTFPDYKKVPKLVTDLVNEINLKIVKAKTIKEKLELSFYAHFQLVSIHPFGDGNGRTSRLIMNYIQAYFNLPLSIVFKENRIAYINALENARKKENIEIFYTFMYSQYQKFLKQEIIQLKK